MSFVLYVELALVVGLEGSGQRSAQEMSKSSAVLANQKLSRPMQAILELSLLSAETFDDPPNRNYDWSLCGAKCMQLWDVPSDMINAPDDCVEDFESVLLRHSFSTFAKEDLEQYEKCTRQFGHDGACIEFGLCPAIII